MRMMWRYRIVGVLGAIFCGWLAYGSAELGDAGWATALGMIAGMFFTLAILGLAGQWKK